MQIDMKLSNLIFLSCTYNIADKPKLDYMIQKLYNGFKQ